MTDEPLAQVVGISVAGGPVAAKPLEVALQLMELNWQALVGEGGVPEADDDEPEQEAGAMLEEVWLAGEAADAASAMRLAALRTIGVVAGDDAAQDAGSVARFLCGGRKRGGDGGGSGRSRGGGGRGRRRTAGRGDGDGGPAPSGSVDAGKACVAALRAVLDVHGTLGAAEVLRGARALRTELGVPASAAARGTLTARALQARVDASPPPPPARRLTRSSPSGRDTTVPPGGSAPTMASPRAALIRRLRAQLQEAEQAATLTPSTLRTLTFEDTADAAGRPTAQRRAAETAPEGEPTPARRRLGELGADALEGLRLTGKESSGPARVVQELDARLGGEGSTARALAKAAGRLVELTPSGTVGSRLALQAAAADWRTLVTRAAVGDQLREDGPPDSWDEATGRLMDVAQAGAHARLAPARRTDTVRPEAAPA
eukprot:6174959-Pleurochrysis_carterae.AAC.1